jgi:hypothetical protein
MKRASRWSAPTLLLVPFLVAAAACGGGGGGSTPTSPPPPESGITFTASGNGTGISLTSAAGSEGTTLELALQSGGVQDLYGVAYHLVYPYSVMHYTGSTQGTLLSASGAVATSFLVSEAPPGTLIVGLTRLGVVPGVSTAGTLMTLQFTAVATGSGTLSFASNQAINSTSAPITAISWNAGSVQATVVGSSTTSAAHH